MKTSELTGAALDWAVAKCSDKSPVVSINSTGRPFIYLGKRHGVMWNPSNNWLQAGSIIAREKINIAVSESGDEWNAEYRFKRITDDEYWSGSTPLIAAMRCYVASKMGDEVEIPEELK